MKIHITNVYGVKGTAMIAQHNVTDIAKKLGFTEMGLQCYVAKNDTQTELVKRVYGIISAVENGDIVIFQSPTWQDDAFRYEKTLLQAIRFRLDTKIVIFIHDVVQFMFGGTEEDYKKTIEIYNMADLVIVPSEAMLYLLREKGLVVKKILVQSMWDLPFDGELRKPEFQRQIFFSGSPGRFQFILSWFYDVPLRLFHENFQLGKQNIYFGGWKNTTELLTEYTNGGFGLIWEQTVNADYYKYNQPYKLAGYLVAGIPVIIQRGLQHADMILDHNWGFAVDSLDEAVRIVQDISEEEYYRLVDNIKNVSFMVRNGIFTKKLLIDTVNTLLFDSERNKADLFIKENTHRLEVFICTNSDQIEHCEELIKIFPQMHFHIAAFTVMSPSLMNMGIYDNVSLYPCISGEHLEYLFEICDYYFDINHQSEIASAVHRAFQHNHLIFAFEETVHDRKYVANEHIYPVKDFDRMVSDIRALMEDGKLLEQHLERQRKMAGC